MRRIIERTVTVVTTTIWRLSWQEDPLPAPREPATDPATDDVSRPDISQETGQHTEQFPPVIEAKEDDLWVTKPVLKPTMDEISDDPNFYQSKKGNEKS
jgi:hypothetical protein